MNLGKSARYQVTALMLAFGCFLAAQTTAQEASGSGDPQKNWFDAVLVGDLVAMAAAADAGMNVDQKDSSGDTALITASLSGDSETVRFLLERGANTDSRAATGATSLMVAAWQGHLKTVQLLLGAGSDANATTVSNGATALIFAAQEGHLNVVLSLLAAGAKPDVQADNGTTALMAATKDGHVDTVRALLNAGANISLQKRSGASAMTIAASKGHDEISDLLAYFIANKNLPPALKAAPRGPEELGASLISSVRIGNEEGVRLLLEQNAPINHRNEANETALIVAADSANANVVKQLLRANPDLEATRSLDGATALTIAARAGQLEIVRALLDAGSKTDGSIDTAQNTERMASSAGKTGAQPDSSTGIGANSMKSPLLLAVSRGHVDVATLLLENGADPTRGDAFGTTPLMVASRNSDTSSANSLISAGADPNARNDDGETALSISVHAEDWAFAELLLENAADPSLLNDEQIEALSIAQRIETAAMTQHASAGHAPESSSEAAFPNADSPSDTAEVALRSKTEIEPGPQSSVVGIPNEEAVLTPEQSDVDRPLASISAAPAVPFDPNDRETIRRIQTMLNEAGFNAGPADGLFGQRTRNAIRDYESEIGLDVSGRITETVFRRLQMETNG